jgi:hypothetical protein
MNTTIRGHNLTVTVLMALIAVLFMMALALLYGMRSAPTAGDRDSAPAQRATSADGARGSTITRDPYIARHAEVVQFLGGGSLH